MSPRPVFVECDNDEAVARAVLGSGAQSLTHYLGKDRVSMALLQQTVPTRAMVDEDPNSIQSSYLISLGKPREFSQHGLKLLHDRERGHWVVVVCPRLEPWILTAAEHAGVDVRDYDLPDSEDLFKKAAKNNSVKFAQLIRKLASSPNIRLLRELLSEPPAPKRRRSR